MTGITPLVTLISLLASAAMPVHVTIRPVVEPGISCSLEDPMARAALAEWLGVQTAGARIEIVNVVHDDASSLRALSSSRLTELARKRAQLPPIDGLEIELRYIVDFEELIMGRAWRFSNGRALVVINARAVARNATGSAWRAREARLLRHEMLHALDWRPPPALLIECGGTHCADPRCLMHARITAADLLATLLPALFERLQPRELCTACRAALRNGDQLSETTSTSAVSESTSLKLGGPDITRFRPAFFAR